MSRPYWVLDTGALMAYAHGVEAVGEVLVAVADAERTVALPSICLIEAYCLLDPSEHELLRMLRRNPAVHTVTPALDLDRDDEAPTIGSMARHTGRLGAGHAAWVALVNQSAVVTSRPDQFTKVLGEGWEILEV
ncbi:hypothetical protein GA0070624_3959 [Micromonospora rhizosphaerae]|uniref:PIN domain-containing protein n=1 Tax=Micromonospora rhizosphaerae TaxID=568872 RepID=A0A1C6SKX1_9ACTN|nr:hypothetical protein [Micromonospora rhizosphaerae]SCL29829.1 hypothetical protein GA0070624_3959 [Micromonospora rhizosphaerae]